MSDRRRRHFAFARLLSSALISQALISAANLAIGLILIRSTTDVQYGYFILASSAVLLLVSLQTAFFNPPLAIRIVRLSGAARGALVGSLYRAQYRTLPVLGGVVIVIGLGLWSAQALDVQTGPLLITTVVAALALLHREFFRMVLLAHRRPQDVLRADLFHVALMVTGVLLATTTPMPAVAAVLALGLAAAASGILLSRALRRREPWSTEGTRHILREIAPLAAWSTTGAAIHWTFSQGYIYLVVGTLGVAAVAAIAGTRLLMMPVNLLSAGIGSLMLPLAAGWLQRHGVALLWRRLCLLGLGLAAVTLCYFAVVWSLRDWIFAVVLKKQFAQRDLLVALWGAIVLVMVVRNQLLYLLAVQERFRALSLLTLLSAVASLAASYWGMVRFGVAGALIGILIGELINVTGVVTLALRKAPHPLIATV